MKSNSKTLTLIAISLVLFIPCYFLVPIPHKNQATFYLVFISTLLSFLLQFYAFAYVYKKRKGNENKIYKLPVLYVSYVFLAFSLLLMIVITTINAFYNVYIWVSILTEIVLFGFYLLAIVAVNEGYVYSDVDELGTGDEPFMVELRDDVKILLSNFRHPLLYNKMERLYEIIICSFTTYNMEIKEIEQEIARNYKILKDAYYDNDMDLVDQQIDKVISLVNLRNNELTKNNIDELRNKDTVL